MAICVLMLRFYLYLRFLRFLQTGNGSTNAWYANAYFINNNEKFRTANVTTLFNDTDIFAFDLTPISPVLN